MFHWARSCFPGQGERGRGTEGQRDGAQDHHLPTSRSQGWVQGSRFRGRGEEWTWHPPGVPHSMSIGTCSIFIMGNNLTNGEFRLITFRLEK